MRDCRRGGGQILSVVRIYTVPLPPNEVKTQFLAFDNDLDLWPPTLTYSPNLARVKVDPCAKIQGHRSNSYTIHPLGTSLCYLHDMEHAWHHILWFREAHIVLVRDRSRIVTTFYMFGDIGLLLTHHWLAKMAPENTELPWSMPNVEQYRSHLRCSRGC